MFNIGDLIVYGNSGVCRVIEIGKPPLTGVPDGVDYYTLAPYYAEKSVIFTPCNNERIVMRPVLSVEEANRLLENADEIGIFDDIEDKRREEYYKDVIKSCDPQKFLRIIKTINIRKQQRIAAGKKVTASDEKYLQMAEEKLYSELSIVLDSDKSVIKMSIMKSVE